mgnify:CR=1 FL=1
MKDLIEIRWHGRGGQGAKTASLLLADAAFNTGKYIQGFPEYGPERTGAPLTAYNRISTTPIRSHSNVYYPDYVVVVDDTLLDAVPVAQGIREGGAIVINTKKSLDKIEKSLKDYGVDFEAFKREIPSMLEDIKKDICTQYNPNKLTDEEYVRLLLKIYFGE